MTTERLGTAAVLTVSSSRTEADDVGGAELARFAEGLGLEVVVRDIVPDRQELIEEQLVHLCDAVGCDAVLTTGGTGFAPDDVTPEATRAVADRLAPGLAEAMRLASREHTKHWMLSRNVTAIRGGSLIVNFPGSPKAIAEAGEAIAEALPHALRLLRGSRDTHS